MLGLFSSRQNWDSPNPSPADEFAPPPLWFRGEGNTRWRERGWGSPNSDEGTYAVVLYIYMYFVSFMKVPVSTNYCNVVLICKCSRVSTIQFIKSLGVYSIKLRHNGLDIQSFLHLKISKKPHGPFKQPSRILQCIFQKCKSCHLAKCR